MSATANIRGRVAGISRPAGRKQEAQEARVVRNVVGEQIAGGIRRGRGLADDHYPKSGRCEGVSHRVQRPGPETQPDALAARGPLRGVTVGREIIGLEAGLAMPQVLCEGMVNGHDEPPTGLEHAPQLG
jgi:hypothetical protein